MIVRIKSPVEFQVKVAGKRLIARIEEDIPHPLDYTYRISFSDGYSDIFSLWETGPVGQKREESKPYSRAISDDIGIIAHIDTDKFYHVFQETVDGINTNIWVIEKQDENDETYYAVYYYSYYRFELRRNKNSWIAGTKVQRDGVMIDPLLAQKVQHLLDSLL